MHDIKAIRENPQAFVQGWSRRGRETAQFDVDAVGHYARPDVFQLKVNARPMTIVERAEDL